MSSTDRLAAIAAELAALGVAGTDQDRIDVIGWLERIKSIAAAGQARNTEAFASSQRERLIRAGTKPGDASRSIGGQVALARRDAPHKGNRHVGLAATLVHEMPGVLGALERGETSEWRATLIARETAHLTREDRAVIDAAIADQLGGWGDARTEREARGWAHRLDPDGAADRARQAVSDRRVSIRPAPDCMTYLTALLPMKEGVGVFGVLHRAAMDAHCTPDDHRSKGQVMADELMRRIMTPGEGEPERPAVEVQLVMTDRTLADADPEPAQLTGYGPIPAAVARDLVRAEDQTRMWVRRLFADPTSGVLLTADARRRDFPEAARTFLAARDQVCRTPYCGAPIRHTDHAVAVSKGGQTDLRNGNGRCVRCNLTKDLAGWTTRVDQDGVITTNTPTGHTYTSRPPRAPRSSAWLPAIQIDIQWTGGGRGG